MDVRVVRSAKRRKTVQARMVDGCLEVLIPARMSEREEAHWVEQMQGRFLRQVDAERIDLDRRATALARRYELPVPSSIRWVSNQRHRWGSCSPWNGEIRISDRLAGWPVWVLDYVIVHELAHLREAGHGPRFQALVDRYPRAERARGFLIAKSGSADPDGVDDVDDVDDEDPVVEVNPVDRRPVPAPAPPRRRGRLSAGVAEAPRLPFG